MKSIKNYLKATYANKFTFSGYISVAVTCGLLCTDERTNFIDGATLLSSINSFILLYGTEYGIQTKKTYEKVKSKIQENPSDAIHWHNSKILHYCDHVGSKLAFKESNLETKIKTKNILSIF